MYKSTSVTGIEEKKLIKNKKVSIIKAEEPSLPYYLPIAGGRIIGFIPFPCEMQSVSARIWTRIAVSISYDDNHYTTRTSIMNRDPN